jgi:hypothetical protein
VALPPNNSAVETTVHSVCIVELHITVNNIKILSVAQQCFYGKFMSPTTMQSIRTSFLNIFQIICTPRTLYINAALKQGMFVCSWPSLDLQFG